MYVMLVCKCLCVHILMFLHALPTNMELSLVIQCSCYNRILNALRGPFSRWYASLYSLIFYLKTLLYSFFVLECSFQKPLEVDMSR
jgi:hypothetical protein